MVLSDKDNDFFNQMEARPRGRGQIERYGGGTKKGPASRSTVARRTQKDLPVNEKVVTLTVL